MQYYSRRELNLIFLKVENKEIYVICKMETMHDISEWRDYNFTIYFVLGSNAGNYWRAR